MNRLAAIIQLLFAVQILVVANCTLLPAMKQSGGEKIRNVDVPYDGSFNLTMENFMDIRFAEIDRASYNIDSATFPATNGSGLTWYFSTVIKTEYVETNEKSLSVSLLVKSLPEGAMYLFASYKCFIINSSGNPEFVASSKESKVYFNRGFDNLVYLKRSILSSRADELLPGGNLNLRFDVKGFLVYKAEAIPLLDKH